jgi:DNA-directed RNA polymerase specialized sigma subunit
VGVSGKESMSSATARERNAVLHATYHRLTDEIAQATADGDTRLVTRLTYQRDRVGAEFFTENRPYAKNLAAKWSGPNRSMADEYLATAYEKLWQAFLSWDPTKGAFTTWARSHIEGGVRREVRRQEFGERSYDDFTARAQVTPVIERLRTELGRTPSIAEIVASTGVDESEVTRLDEVAATLESVTVAQLAAAAAVSPKQAKRFLDSRKRLSQKLGRQATAAEVSADTGLTRGVVERALVPVAARLDAPVRSEGTGSTLGERLADTLGEQVLLEDDRAWLGYVSGLFDGLSGQQVWFLLRSHGLDGSYPQTIRELSAQTDIGRESARKILEAALESVTAARLAAAAGVSSVEAKQFLDVRKHLSQKLKRTPTVDEIVEANAATANAAAPVADRDDVAYLYEVAAELDALPSPLPTPVV